MIETIRVDLHCHSSLSDGDHSPAYVAHSIAAVGAEWAALTDHNTVSGQHQFRTVLEGRGVHSLVGLEMDARSPVGVLHLLGYGFDPNYQPLLDSLIALRQPWRTSARQWMSRIRSLGGNGADDAETDSQRILNTSPHLPPGTGEVIHLIHEAGGLAFLAHPLAGIGTMEDLETVLSWLQPEGLDGIEAFHKQYSCEVQGALLSIAEHRGLLTVAGSDFHGVHHSDGGSPGVDMPLVNWKEFVAALRYGSPKDPPAPYLDRSAT